MCVLTYVHVKEVECVVRRSASADGKPKQHHARGQAETSVGAEPEQPFA